MNPTRFGLTAYAAAATFPLAFNAHAALVIQQDVGQNYIAWEAESGDPVIGVDGPRSWSVDTDSVVATGPAGSAGAGNIASITWTLEITNAPAVDDWNLFVLGGATDSDGVGGSGGHNSFFSPDDFNLPSGSADVSEFDNGSGFNNITWRTAFDAVEASTFGNGSTVTFTFQFREPGYLIDRIVLSPDSLSSSQLDALTNSAIVPEPASLVLAATGLGLLVVRRHRRG
ncbi:MAG: PEP-CTERM sorting domain-containing protein [Planctomycetota bacterium]